MTADIVPKGQGDRGLGFVELAGFQHFGQANDLSILVGNLDTHRGLARNDLNHTHTDDGKRASQILGQVGNLADLHARGRLNFKPRDNRPRLHFLDLSVDAKVLELDFKQPRHAFQ